MAKETEMRAAGRRRRGSLGCSARRYGDLVGQGLRQSNDCGLKKRGWTQPRRAPHGLPKPGNESPRFHPVLQRHGDKPGPGAFASIADWQRRHRRDVRRECAVAPALAETLWLPLHVHAFIVPPEEVELQDFLTENRRSLSKHVRARFSVREGRRTYCWRPF